MSGINVSLEVAAMAEEPLAQTESEEKRELYGKIGWAAYEQNKYNERISHRQKS